LLSGLDSSQGSQSASYSPKPTDSSFSSSSDMVSYAFFLLTNIIYMNLELFAFTFILWKIVEPVNSENKNNLLKMFLKVNKNVRNIFNM
jgi:hypothetical protein